MASGTIRFRSAATRWLARAGRCFVLTAGASCAAAPSAPPAPAPGTATIWGEARLVPRPGAEPSRRGAYADERYRHAEPVDYDRVDFAVVHVDGPASAPQPIEIRFEESQFGLRFVPPLAATTAGSDVVVRNATRSARTLSSPEARVLRRIGPGESTSIAAAEAGPIELRLLEDREAAAKVFIAAGPFSLVRPDGRYEIAGLAPGRVLLHAWHARFPGETVEIDLAADETRRVDLKIGVGQMEEAAR